MADIRTQLNQIWGIFRGVGIADDLTIIEHIAGLLVQQAHLKPPRPDLLPQSAPTNFQTSLNDIRSILRALSAGANIGGIAELFDRYVLFRLSERLPGERYPTPRHIVRFMHTVAGVGPQHALADFACGSGGVLALRPQPTDDSIITFGCEIAPVWARLAWANCALHNIPNPQIIIGNALSSLPDSAPASFDRVVMNPPFGPAAGQSTSSSTVGRSETALTRMALDKLADQGRVCVLTPFTTLSGGGAEEKLRQRLVDDHTLDAIISLPKDAFQPYSPMQTYLLLATNATPDDTTATWFLRAERDGYKSGRGRDLTHPPDKSTNDLPLIEEILAQNTDQWDHIYPADRPLIGWKSITTLQSGQGIVVGVIGSAQLMRVERYDSGKNSLLLVSLKHDAQTTFLAIDRNTRQTETASEDREDYLRNKFNVAKKDLPHGVLLHREENGGVAFAIGPDGQLLGTLVPRATLKQNDYDLQPERYAHAEEQRGPLKPAGELLADIRKNQRRLTRRVDSLLGRLEMPPVAEGQVLAPLWLDEQEALAPMLALLSDEQWTVWKNIRTHSMTIGPAEHTYDTPVYFTAEAIVKAAMEDDVPAPVVYSTIDLLEHLGLIAAVSVLKQPDQPRIAAYRLVSTRDRWNIELPEPEATP